MSELRRDPVSAEWVIVGSNPQVRALDFRRSRLPETKPHFVDTCPFCPGHEDSTPSELYALWDQGQNHWEIRVVPDQSPVLAREGVTEPQSQRLHRRMQAVGRHDVIVETPDHALSLHCFADAQLEDLIGIYKACFGILSSDERVEHVTIFRNHGPGTGSIVVHPHSQLIGTPIVPSYVSQRLESAAGHYYESGECVFCALVEQELEEKQRIIWESEHFVALEPFASPSPFVTEIHPRRHAASFGAIHKDEIRELARSLKAVLTKFYVGLNDPDYTFMVHTAPKGQDEVPYFHWYLSLVPCFPPSSFGRGSAIPSNPILPEDAAAFLRAVGLEKEQPSCLTTASRT